MKALFVWDSDYPWDVRVEKICNTLIENKWEVHLVCRNKLRRPIEEIHNDVHIHRLPFLPAKLGSLNNIVTFPAFFSPLWLFQINKVTIKQKPDLIIVRDLPMALAAIIIGKIHKIPVILDMAEPYPEMIRLIWKFEPFKFSNILVRNPFLADIIEKLTLKYVDHVFAMVEESKNRLVSKGISPDKISIVSNTPVLKRFEEAKATLPGLLGNQKGKLILLYVGFINLSRGLDTVLESLSQFIKINNNFFLVLLGTGNAAEHLKTMAKKLKIENHIGFEGWVDNKLVPEYIASSDICIVPHHKCGHWDNTIPNKLFDYMAAGKPVLVSDVKPMERVVQETGGGLIYKDYDKESFVSQLAKLQDSELRKKLGQNGAKAVQEFYNWDNDTVRMLNSLKRFIKYD